MNGTVIQNPKSFRSEKASRRVAEGRPTSRIIRGVPRHSAFEAVRRIRKLDAERRRRPFRRPTQSQSEESMCPHVLPSEIIPPASRTKEQQANAQRSRLDATRRGGGGGDGLRHQSIRYHHSLPLHAKETRSFVFSLTNFRTTKGCLKVIDITKAPTFLR